MTKDMELLGMTDEGLQARQAKVSQLLNGEAPTSYIDALNKALGDQLKASIALVTRKKRKDAGIPKGPKPTQTGCISSVQAARLRDLIDTKQSRLAELDAIKDQLARILAEVDAATAELDAYLRELQGI